VHQCIFFSIISGPFSLNLDRDTGPRSRFFNFFPFLTCFIVPGLSPKIKIDLSNFGELLFHIFPFLGVSVIESLINGGQKLVFKEIKIFF
jgi:hypothetical protein